MAIGIELAASGERPPYSHTRTARRSADGEAAEAGRTQVSSFSTRALASLFAARPSTLSVSTQPSVPAIVARARANRDVDVQCARFRKRLGCGAVLLQYTVAHVY